MNLTFQPIDPGTVEELIDTGNVTGWDYLWAVLTVLAAFLIAWIVRRVFLRSLDRVHGIPPRFASLITTSTTWSIRLLGVVFALPFIGVDVGPVVIFILVLFALAVIAGRVILENYGAGLILQTRSPFQVGDEIVSLGYDGAVQDINGRSVVILTQDGKRVAIPNSTVLNNPIETLTANDQRRSELVVGVEYGTDLDRARKVLLEAMEGVDGVMSHLTPEAYVVEYADSSIDFLVRFWHRSDILSGYVVTDEVARSINRALRRHGIVIAFPQRTLWWGNGRDADGPPARPVP